MDIRFVSQSMLNTFYRCPEQFKRRYLEGDIIPPGISARRGSATHKAAEINHIQKKESKKDLPVDDLKDAARDEYVRLIRHDGVFIPKDQLSEKSKLLNDGLNSAVKLTELYRRELAPKIIPAIVEESITLDVGLQVPLKGIIDLITEDHWFCDIKTSAKSPIKTVADNSLQITFYWGLANSIGINPAKISLEYLIDTKEAKHHSIETTRGENDFRQLIMRLSLMLRQIETGLYPPCGPDFWACDEKWCGYFLTCIYTRR